MLGYQKRRPVLNRNSQAGFTLVELLIAVAILGILASLALPEFKTWIANSRIRTATETIRSGLQLARNEATRLNTNVEFVLGPGAGWTVRVASPVSNLQTKPEAEGTSSMTVAITPAAATTVTFNSLGRVVLPNNADGSAPITQIEVDVPPSVIPASLSRQLQITISSGGQVKACDTSVAASDPRTC